MSGGNRHGRKRTFLAKPGLRRFFFASAVNAHRESRPIRKVRFEDLS